MGPSLVADVGGTNTRVALARGPRVLRSSIRRYRNAEHDGLESLLRAYVEAEGGVACAGAAVAVAGPVRDGIGTLTNLDWRLDRETLARATGAAHAAILNDLQAQGHALGRIDPALVRLIVPGAGAARGAGPGAASLVVNVGTGFNVAPVWETERGRLVTASESGHAALPVRDAAELRLARFVAHAEGFASVEDVLSGRGIERVHAWLAEEAGEPRAASARAIMEGLAEDEPRAREAAEVFARVLGAVCGDLALVHLPFGGLYLVGGVARAMGPRLAALGFTQALRDKGRFSRFMEDFPVFVIEDDLAALTGLAAHLEARMGA